MQQGIVDNVLDEFSVISLAEMEEVRLMNRVDTKYTTSISFLPIFMNSLKEDYLVQVVNDSRLSAYRTLYLDTADREMYIAHHNGQRTREKIRVRAYNDSQTIFLEVKNKNNKGVTKKKRLELPEVNAYKKFEGIKFLKKHAKYPPETLLPRMESRFHRITLVNRKKTERLTIDLNLSFFNPSNGVEQKMDDLVIVELKQQGRQHSIAKDVLSELRICQNTVSKYCLGTILTVPGIKSNLLKEKVNYINKIRTKQYEFV